MYGRTVEGSLFILAPAPPVSIEKTQGLPGIAPGSPVMRGWRN